MAKEKIIHVSGWSLRSLFLNVPGPISQNGDIYSNDASSPKRSLFQISVKSVQPFEYKKEITYFTIAYTFILCKLNYGNHN